MSESAPFDFHAEHDAFARDGYLALRGFFSGEEIDAAENATQRALRERPMEFVVDDLSSGERTFYGLAANAERGWFKFNDLYLQLPEVRELALDARLSALLRELLRGQAPALCNSLTLVKGSNQPMHIDSLFMTPRTPHNLVATWIAFENARPEAGPLGYYPGSHKIPLYRFRSGSHHASPNEMPQWNDYISAEVNKRGLTKETFLARKGDVFIWHSDLLHGGEEIRDPASTRRSLVCHYFGENDCRGIRDWHLQPLHSGFWIDRLPQGVRAAPERFDEAHPFPSDVYLRRHPDVQNGIARRWIDSALEHYRKYGYGEGRMI